MNHVMVVFDDTAEKGEVICDVIGSKGFADVVVKKKRLEEYYQETIKGAFHHLEWKTVRSVYEFRELMQKLELIQDGSARVLHVFSNFIITDSQKAALTFEKIKYIQTVYRILSEGRLCGLMFDSMQSYALFLKACCGENISEAARAYRESMEIEGLVDIGVVSNFIQCITGNFDSRYFNSLEGDEYTIVKSSSNRKKIRSEYVYYRLLPDDMKYWFVMPFDYKEEEGAASYRMERLHMTDLAVRWVHGSIDEEEFSGLMDKYFYFFKCRHKKKVSRDEYMRCRQELYVSKVSSRVNELKKLSEYGRIARLLAAGYGGETIDGVLDKYKALKKRIEKKTEFPFEMAVGHGDPCFANALYNKSTKMLKFIDPKGALNEDELWTDPYYDIAKLSHSVCGRYDFFNNALFEIRVGSRLEHELCIAFNNEKYKNIFRKKCEENGFYYWAVRIYEASLFLSMLPLHIDYPDKVYGFILNAVNILKEIEENVQ